jgi:hypothetical protein
MALSRHRELENVQRREQYEKSSGDRLARILAKKLNTSFIGAISRFEQFFGHLWGHGQSEADCTPEQLMTRETWEKCRREILDNGNQQKRAVAQELQMYDVTWNRYETVLRPPTSGEKE